MWKRIAALAAVTVIILAALAGCGGRLSAREYYDALYANCDKYIAAMNEIKALYPNVSNGEISIDSAAAESACKSAEDALDSFSELKPPKKFEDKHKTLLDTVKLEKEYVAGLRKAFYATTAEGFIKFAKEAGTAFSETPVDKQFTAVFRSLLAEVAEAAGV